MQIFSEIQPLRAFLSGKKAAQESIGLVPTMGALHHGHLSLIQASKTENQVTLGTIYVNPTQFNSATDLEKYPRSLDQDIALLKDGGCDVLFCPANHEMYANTSSVKFDFGQLDKILEGEFRPGHFSGVALVVSKLFNIVQPDVAYFGQKDFQQFMIIERLVEELKFGIKLRCIPTQREPDGLAMSSRNLRLSKEERKKAVVLFKSLSHAHGLIKNGKELGTVKDEIKKIWAGEPGLKLEYFELANRENLIVLDSVKHPDPTILLIAGMVGEVRLIDNLIVG